MPHKFGLHFAREVIEQGTTFTEHATDDIVWPSLSDSKDGRMTKADIAEGKHYLAGANAAMAAHGHNTGFHDVTYVVDSADDACVSWLHLQAAHVRRYLVNHKLDALVTTFNNKFTQSESHQSHVQNVGTFIALAKADDDLGKAATAALGGPHIRDAHLKDGKYLADALAHQITSEGAAKGAGVAATTGKDEAIDRLARWIHGWSLVAHRVCSPGALSALGLAGARHHPEHRKKHPAGAPSPPPGADKKPPVAG